MDSTRWKKIQELFDAALERDAAGRDAFLRAECAGDDALYDEVQSLLAADASEHSLLDGVAVDAIGVPGEVSWEGRVVGNYRVVKRIGIGGMGAVFLAERADGHFEQQVALKVIKRGMDSEEILRRFHSERQILARLDHPNIARLLDGGISDDGVPYFTMEYVSGTAIDEYCNDHELTVDERLELFEVVCGAVTHAQLNLVVHRDLKPSNIMVTADGTVKLLDFGIAKFIDDDDAASPGITRTGLRVMTPGYAAPEQVRGEPVTTATDVYALGVILYELLTGSRPYRPGDDTPRALEEAILTDVPERPSTMRRSLAGDLDTICLMALRKEPERRYHTAEQFLDDIRRYRAGRPVMARADTLRYRVQKFVRRNAVGVMAAAAVFVVLAATVTYYTAQVTEERDRARLEAAKAKTVSDYVVSLFEVADPNQSRGETVTARELVDRGKERLVSELADQPEVQAQMMLTIGNVYQSLGLYDSAAELVKQSLTLRQNLFGRDNPDVIESMTVLGAITTARGDYEGAAAELRGALARARRALEPNDPLIAKISNNLAIALNELAQYEEAETLYRDVLAIWAARGEPDARDAVVALNNLALVLHERGEFEQSREMFEKALTTQRRVFGDVHPEVATTLYNYGQLLRAMGDWEGAERIQREGLEMDRKVFGPDHPDVSYSMNSLAILLQRRGDYAGADTLYRAALSLRRRTLGDDHPEVAYSLGGVANLDRVMGRYDEAESLFAVSLEMHKRLNGPDHPTVAVRINSIGDIETARGHYVRAEDLYRQGMAINVKALGDESPALATNLMQLAGALSGQGRHDDALDAIDRALAMTRKFRGDDHYLVASCLQVRSKVLAAKGDLDAAETSCRDAIAITKKEYPETHVRYASVIAQLADVQRRRGEYSDAERLYLQALDVRTSRLPARHPAIGETLVGLGETLVAAGDPRGAVPYLRKGIDILRNTVDDDHPDVVAARAALDRCAPDAGGSH